MSPARQKGDGSALGTRQEYRFSGSGGQGLLLAAMLLADAATALGKEVVQTQSYGPEARGGASRSEVIVSDEEIDFPELEAPDVSLCLSQPAYDQFAARTRSGGLLIYDSGLVVPRDIAGVQAVGLSFTAMAREHAGTPMAANVVSLATLARLAGTVGLETLQESLHRRMPKKLVEANLRALAAGWDAAGRLPASVDIRPE